MATGIPVAIDTYRKTVKSANAQVALSTTVTVLRSELGTATGIFPTHTAGGDPEIYYLSEEGYWACIRKTSNYRGLEKQYYMGMLDGSNPVPSDQLSSDSSLVYPLVSDSAITSDLSVAFENVSFDSSNKTVSITGLKVVDTDGNKLASVDNPDGYLITERFLRWICTAPTP
jgi:hypothetical protein